MIPTKNEVSHILAALQKAQHDQLIIKTAIRERLAVAIEASDDSKVRTSKTKIEQKPLNILENEYQKLFSNIVHLSERHALATLIYRLSNPYETLDPTLITINNDIPSLASLWPNTKSRDINTTTEQESKHRRKEMMRLNESLLDLPEVLINSIKRNKDGSQLQDKDTGNLLVDWYWLILSIDCLLSDLIAFDISYSPKVILKQPKINSRSENNTIVKQLQFSTRHSGHVIVVRIISRNLSSQYSIQFDYHLSKSFYAFTSFVLHKNRDVLEISDATITGKLVPSSLPEFINSIIWPEMAEEFGIN
ncbi:7560_t:CDS:2 [Ambispora leptoticha]|uniref:7560_t:CDS:1 n=1 Tax=Ambispora leptoticha TaxID=144679 RepID=A0A9N8WKE0_9GLOM|nr:7560_t:CDS:2 [Ambispora leptoticha]